MIRFLCSKKFLVLCLSICLFFLYLYAMYGSAYVHGLFLNFWMWFTGGDYRGYSVLSTAFVMNTWGVAVRSIRRRVQLQCKRHVEHVLEKLSRAVMLSRGKEGVLEFAWRERKNPKVQRQVGKLISAIEYYNNMLPGIFTISVKVVNATMILFAVISVVCLIKEVNGRFAAFLLLPYPMFWVYSFVSSFYVRGLLNYRLYRVLWLTPKTEAPEDMSKLITDLNKMESMFKKMSASLK